MVFCYIPTKKSKIQQKVSGKYAQLKLLPGRLSRSGAAFETGEGHIRDNNFLVWY